MTRRAPPALAIGDAAEALSRRPVLPSRDGAGRPPWLPGALSALLHGGLLAALLLGLPWALRPPERERGVEMVWEQVAEDSLALSDDSGAPLPPPRVDAPETPESEPTPEAPPPPTPPPPAPARATAPPPQAPARAMTQPPPVPAPATAQPPPPPAPATVQAAPAPPPPAPRLAEAPPPPEPTAEPVPQAPMVAEAPPPETPQVAEAPPPETPQVAATPQLETPRVAEAPPPAEPPAPPQVAAVVSQPAEPRPAEPPAERAQDATEDLPLPPPQVPPPPPTRVAEARQPPPRPAPEPMRPMPGINPLGASAEAERQAALVGASRAIGAVVPPGLLDGHRNPQPEYPSMSRLRGEQGVVALVLRVAPSGQVTGVEVGRSSGFPALDEAARKAAARWRFRPALRDGVAIDGTIRTQVHFRLVQ